jgi:hypothetical protein
VGGRGSDTGSKAGREEQERPTGLVIMFERGGARGGSVGGVRMDSWRAIVGWGGMGRWVGGVCGRVWSRASFRNATSSTQAAE